MPNEYSENSLVQENAAKLLKEELGWGVVHAHNTEVLGENGTLGRKTEREVLLVRYFRQKLIEFNPWLTEENADKCIQTFTDYLVSASLLQINEEKYQLILEGIPVPYKYPNGSEQTRRAAVIDFEHPERNHFLAVKELWVQGEIYRRRPDIMGFVNGIPLLFVELKKHDVDVKNAYVDNYRDYLDTIPQIFHYNAMVMLSNGEQAKVGTLGSPYEFFHEWKRLQEREEGNVELATMLRGLCKKENLLDILSNFIIFDHSGNKSVKILARNHQYLGVNQAVEAYKNRQENGGKLGVFWHTQGSGKSYSMLFLTRKIRRVCPGSPTFVILTDRDELNKQISETFASCGMLGKVEPLNFIASSGENLIQKLEGNPSFIFTLIQKFNDPSHPPIKPEHDIVIISDEAHRTQYGKFANAMCNLLPTAAKIGFTGTPLFSYDELTRRTFGEYVSVYDFQRAVQDGATVPLFYENRGEKLHLDAGEEMNTKIADALEEADLDPSQRERLERALAKEIHVLTAERRLRALAKDFVHHYSELWTTGKAMFVCLNKVTCVKMYNYVQEYWAKEIKCLEKQKTHVDQQEWLEIERKIAWMQETEMAVVVSEEQNELQTFQQWGLDILPHREKMKKRDLDREFKDADNPFRIVFVCAMWLTGFDVKSLSCLYLDKPLKAHALMQAIARANRVSEGKNNGLIIDYVGIIKALKKALATYVTSGGTGGGSPTVDKTELLKKLRELLGMIETLLDQNGFKLQELVDAASGKEGTQSFLALELISQAKNAICATPELRKTYLAESSLLERLGMYANSDELTTLEKAKMRAISAIRESLLRKKQHFDDTELLVEINKIVSESVSVEAEGNGPERKLDISAINFGRLAREFAKSRKRNLILDDLSALIKERVQRMAKINPSCIHFAEKYEEIIEEYNKDQDKASIEKTFEELMALADSLDKEQKRCILEGFSDEQELAVYDLLFSDQLDAKDIATIKKLSKDLLAGLRKKIAELNHCWDRPNTKAEISQYIVDMLWNELPEPIQEKWEDLGANIYEYVFSQYRDYIWMSDTAYRVSGQADEYDNCGELVAAEDEVKIAAFSQQS